MIDPDELMEWTPGKHGPSLRFFQQLSGIVVETAIQIAVDILDDHEVRYHEPKPNRPTCHEPVVSEPARQEQREATLDLEALMSRPSAEEELPLGFLVGLFKPAISRMIAEALSMHLAKHHSPSNIEP